MDGTLKAWGKRERDWYEDVCTGRANDQSRTALIEWCRTNVWHLFVTQTSRRLASAQGMAALTTRCLADWDWQFGMARALWSIEPYEEGGFHAHMLLWTHSWRTFRDCDSRCKSAKLPASKVCGQCNSRSDACAPPLEVNSIVAKTSTMCAGRLPWWKLANEFFGATCGWCRTYWIGDKPVSAINYVVKYLMKKIRGMDDLPWGIYTANNGGH